MWIVGGVTLGVLVGLLTTQLFPNTVLVDRPVEKIVERPVEVIRTVEKRVDVPAVLTAEQMAAEVFFRRFFDVTEHKKGNPLFKVSNRVKVFTNFSGDGKHVFSEGLVRSRVESVFRNQGFTVLSEDSKEYPYSIIDINGNILDSGSRVGVSVSGSYSIEISQYVNFVSSSDIASPSGIVIKSADLMLFRKAGVLVYGSQHFGEIPGAYEKFAQEAAGELRKAYDN
jgi:hypothetical protein